MRIVQNLLHTTGAAAISLGAFGSMALLLGIRPAFDLAILEPVDDIEHVVYAADVDAALDALAALETPAPVPEPEPVEVEDAVEAPEEVGEPAAPPEAAPVETVLAVNTDTPQPEASRVPTREERLLAAQERRARIDAERKKKRRRSCLEEVDSIAEIGDNRYRVERDLVDYYSNHLNEAARLGYAHWYREEGEVVGFRIRRIRCGNVLHQAGFRNGDVIRSINGREVTTIPQALLAYRKLRRKKKLTVEVTRRDGQSVVLHYRLS